MCYVYVLPGAAGNLGFRVLAVFRFQVYIYRFQ